MLLLVLLLPLAWRARCALSALVVAGQRLRRMRRVDPPQILVPFQTQMMCGVGQVEYAVHVH